MKSYKRLFVMLLAFGVLYGASCKKKNNSNPFGNSKIATVTMQHAGSLLHYRMVYDSYSNVDSIVVTGDSASAGYSGFLAFSYFGTSYSVTDQSNTTFTVDADGNGNILKLLVADTTSMIYNGSELGEMDIRVTQPTAPYFSIIRTNYTWKGGDVSSDSTGGPAYTFAYDNSKAGQPGDAWRIDEFLNYGRSWIKTTHLPISKTYNGAWVEKYYYQTDGSGRLSQYLKVINNGGGGADDSTFYNYTY